MISLQNISKRYGKHEALQSVSLEFTRGQSIAMIGPNGSGKTTLIKSILGLVVPSEGAILVNNIDITAGCDYRKTIGYMPQINRFPEHMKVSHLFAMMKKMRPDVSDGDYDEELYRAFEIEKMEKKKLGALSGGMSQQVSAALAFLFNPSMIILDEPTAALDPVSNELLKGKINKCVDENKLVLITSHILNDLDEITTHVVYLMEGKVRFFKAMEVLRAQTSESRLNKIIVRLINEEFANVEA
ncbi:ATP-binding cassette domain-containing protein [Fulvivirga sp. M361]|uniref:ABC transporter ATP-binding protein n=1 Tax=Fulvivirga sp. M361 TaxID=2594266 RepID=UPI00117AA13C|nr:ATP-binding cassette domain-containing protein [Fulvivirga sp. M361]TRX52217.1 ATP-binding cassette domain-containing protein [Fulvivirga sp. M361]